MRACIAYVPLERFSWKITILRITKRVISGFRLETTREGAFVTWLRAGWCAVPFCRRLSSAQQGSQSHWILNREKIAVDQCRRVFGTASRVLFLSAFGTGKAIYRSLSTPCSSHAAVLPSSQIEHARRLSPGRGYRAVFTSPARPEQQQQHHLQEEEEEEEVGVSLEMSGMSPSPDLSEVQPRSATPAPPPAATAAGAAAGGMAPWTPAY